MEIHPVKNIARLTDILVILLKYGFEDIVEKIKLPGLSLFRKEKVKHAESSNSERLRMVLEDLGTTFVKMGQMLSMRPDLIPPPLLQELQKLQDNVPPEDYDVVKKQIELNFNSPIDDIFSQFNQTPISAGSVAQVHYAILRENNREVAVKVQRTGIQETVSEDLNILSFLASQVHKYLEAYKVYDLPAIVREVRLAMRYELNFSLESRNMDVFRINFSGNQKVHIPEVIHRWTTGTILTMEYISGTKLQNLPPDYAGRQELALVGIHAILQQILQDGFFHADPHAGNILVMKNGQLCFVDFGMVGVLTEDMRFALIDLLDAFLSRDSKGIAKMVLQLGEYDVGVNKMELERDILRLVIQIDPTMVKAQIGKSLLELGQILKTHKIHIPSVFFMIFKTIFTVEILAFMLYPECHIWEEIKPFIEEITRMRLSPALLMKEVQHDFADASRFMRLFPARLENLFRRIEEQKIAFSIRHQGLESLTQSFENISNRVSYSIIIGSLIIGSSLIITAGIGPLIFGFPVLGITGFFISGVMGIWLTIHMIKRKKL